MAPEDPQYDLSEYVVTIASAELPMGVRRTSPIDYVTPVLGNVVHGKTIGEGEVICDFSFQHLRVRWARHDGFALKKVFGISPVYDEMFEHLFDPTTERSLFAPTDPSAASDVLFVDEMSIVPEHRGRGLGGHVLDRLASEYLGLWGLMVLRAVPAPIESGEWSERIYSRPFPTSGEAATKKLRVHSARFGFRPLGKTDFMARDVSTLATSSTSLRAL